MIVKHGKHTPGPWISYAEPDGEISICMRDDDGTCGPHIATVHTGNLTDDDDDSQAVADARLISLAPDAHAILCELWEFFRHNNEPCCSSLFDGQTTWKQAVEEYITRVHAPVPAADDSGR